MANALNEPGADALQGGNYENARGPMEQATRLSESRQKVRALQKE